MSRITQKTLAIVVTAAFATASPLVMAQAQEAPVSPSVSNPENQQSRGVDVKAPASLTIKKILGEVGSETQPSGKFRFKIEKIKTASLDTSEGWKDVNAIVKDPEQDLDVSGYTTIITEENGESERVELSVGLYRVTEVESGDFTVAAPFFVTLPLNNADGTLDYNPTISPKTQNVEPKITAEDTNVGIGGNIHYTINAPVPVGDVSEDAALKDGIGTIGDFKIVNKLGPGLKNVEGSAEVKLIDIETGKPLEIGKHLKEGDHYTVKSSNDGSLIVDFKPRGRRELAKLRKDNLKLGVEVTFDAEVVGLPANGALKSDLSVTIPNRNKPIEKTISTQYVDVKITNPLDETAPAIEPGSEFDIIACTQQEDGVYKVTTNAKPLHHTDQDGKIKLEGSIKSVSSQHSIEALGYGLQFTMNSEGVPAQEYCAVQTKAPKGYMVNPTLIPLETQNVPEGERPVFTTTVENSVKNNLFGRLPATGERTMLALLVLGLVLFAGGAAYQLRRKNA